jgi:hypothetical protein
MLGGAIAVGTSLYYSSANQEILERKYHSLWVLRFAADGRCGSFTEWYMKAPAAEAGSHVQPQTD